MKNYRPWRWVKPNSHRSSLAKTVKKSAKHEPELWHPVSRSHANLDPWNLMCFLVEQISCAHQTGANKWNTGEVVQGLSDADTTSSSRIALLGSGDNRSKVAKLDDTNNIPISLEDINKTSSGYSDFFSDTEIDNQKIKLQIENHYLNSTPKNIIFPESAELLHSIMDADYQTDGFKLLNDTPSFLLMIPNDFMRDGKPMNSLLFSYSSRSETVFRWYCHLINLLGCVRGDNELIPWNSGRMGVQYQVEGGAITITDKELHSLGLSGEEEEKVEWITQKEALGRYYQLHLNLQEKIMRGHPDLKLSPKDDIKNNDKRVSIVFDGNESTGAISVSPDQLQKTANYGRGDKEIDDEVMNLILEGQGNASKEMFLGDKSPVEELCEITRLVTSVLVYIQALGDEVLIEGVPLKKRNGHGGIPMSLREMPSKKKSRPVIFNLKGPKRSFTSRAGGYRRFHFRTLTHEKYYQGEHARKPRGSRVVFVRDAWIKGMKPHVLTDGKDIDNKVIRRENYDH